MADCGLDRSRIDRPHLSAHCLAGVGDCTQLSAAIVLAAHEASTDAFHLAVLTGAVLMAAGAAVNFVGLRPGARDGADGAGGPPADPPTG